MCVIRSIERSIHRVGRDAHQHHFYQIDSGSKVRLSCRQYAHLEGKWKISPSANTHTHIYTVARVAISATRGPECRPKWWYPRTCVRPEKSKKKQRRWSIARFLFWEIPRIDYRSERARNKNPRKNLTLSKRYCTPLFRKKGPGKTVLSLCLAYNHIYSHK